MENIVTKFGGSSLADAQQMRKVHDIVLAKTERRFLVPSAPGKRFSGDEKVTDLLYECFRAAKAGEDIDAVLGKIQERYDTIIAELGLALSLKEEYASLAEHARSDETADYVASRGEYLNGRILAAYLDWEFVDPADLIRFDENGTYNDAETAELAARVLAGKSFCVIPGFYGATKDGIVHTFSRGGSDITGAIVARAVSADLYENWTDVSGFMMADPRIVENPRTIRYITYKELRELSYMGATVLHDEAIFPVRQAGIPINIRNTNAPERSGTLIVDQLTGEQKMRGITGVAGHRGFTAISVEKAMMNGELGFGRRILQVLEKHGISFEHMPTGIDTLSVIVSDKSLNGNEEAIVREIEDAVHPDSIELHRDMALIATVGQGMIRIPGMASRLFTALALAQVNVRMIDQGSSEINIIVGVEGKDFECAVRAIYEGFVGV